MTETEKSGLRLRALGVSIRYPEDVEQVRSAEMQRAVITIATGKPIYLAMAINLARSFLFWHPHSDIAFYIVSDRAVTLPADLDVVRVICVKPGALGIGYASKLHLDRVAPAKQTLFIDADCLCVGNLSSVFDRFSGHGVSVIGGTIADGEWFGDVAKICSHFNLQYLPKFVGGVYYLEPGAKASAVYTRARLLEPDYDELGLVRLRGQPNEELLMAIAMALEGCEALSDDGSISGDLFYYPIILELNVLLGKCRLFDPGPMIPSHRSWHVGGEVRPLIVHFLGHYNSSWQYRAEAKKLRLVFENGIPTGASRLLVNWTYQFPARYHEELKAKLRPIFHRLFGPRKMKSANR